MSKLLLFGLLGSHLGCKVVRPRKATRELSNSGRWVCASGYHKCTENEEIDEYNEHFNCCHDNSQCIWDYHDPKTLSGCIKYDSLLKEYDTICTQENIWHISETDPETRGCLHGHCSKDDYCCDLHGGISYGEECQCPHDRFLKCHVCPDCQTEEEAEAFSLEGRVACNNHEFITIFSQVTKSSIFRPKNTCATYHSRAWLCTWVGDDFDPDPDYGYSCHQDPTMIYPVQHLKNNGHYISK